MEVTLPLADANCKGLCAADFDEYRIPAPPQGHREDSNDFILQFKSAEEATMYAIHLNDVYERMEASSNYDCSRKKIKQIIKAVNDQIDFKAFDFDS